jgi:hypothetical protein
MLKRNRGMGPTQIVVLEALRASKKPVRRLDLEALTDLTRPQVVSALRGLERRGAVKAQSTGGNKTSPLLWVAS